VCRWDNYKDAEGNDIPHGDFSRFSFTQLQELILAVFQSQKLSEKEAGNSN